MATIDTNISIDTIDGDTDLFTELSHLKEILENLDSSKEDFTKLGISVIISENNGEVIARVEDTA